MIPINKSSVFVGNRRETRTNDLADLTALWAFVGCGLRVSTMEKRYLLCEGTDFLIWRLDRSNGSGSGDGEHTRDRSDNCFD